MERDDAIHHPGGNQELTVIREQAVYKLAFRSRKPEAERFTDWVADVIATIRKTGIYVQPSVRDTTLIPSEQQTLSEIVARKAETVPKELIGKALAEIWSRVHHKFRISKYAQLLDPAR